MPRSGDGARVSTTLICLVSALYLPIGSFMALRSNFFNKISDPPLLDFLASSSYAPTWFSTQRNSGLPVLRCTRVLRKHLRLRPPGLCHAAASQAVQQDRHQARPAPMLAEESGTDLWNERDMVAGGPSRARGRSLPPCRTRIAGH